VSVLEILKDAKAVVYRAHTPVQLAVNAAGVNVRPRDPGAVAWSSTGALGKVAPWMSGSDDRVWFDLTEDGKAAWDLLNEAARLQGYRDDTAAVTLVDRDGLSAVLRMFAKAILIAPDEPRRARFKTSAATGGSPRGAAS
jgi:hypothetical protein